MRTTQPSPHHQVDKEALPFYPFQFGIGPVLALAAIHIAQIDFS